MNIGKAIREVRIKVGMTQLEASAKIGCTPTYLSLVECGRKQPSKAMMKKIAKAFKVAPIVIVSLGAEESDFKPTMRNDTGKEVHSILKGVIDLYFSSFEEIKSKNN